MAHTRSAVLLIFLNSLSVQAAAEIPFGDGTLFAVQDGASSVAVADLNRDGYQDVVVATIDSDTVQIRFGGTTPIYRFLTSSFDRACFVVIADVDQDGFLDVVGGKRGTGDDQVRWWKNSGGTSSWTEHAVSGIFFDEARGLDTSDLDQDGDPDILVAGVDAGTGYVSWFENTDGAGTSWSLHDITSGFTGAHDVHVVDINGDGLPDVVASSYDLDTVAWFENDGTIVGGGYWVSHLVVDSFDGALAVDAGDFDQDGDPDIVAGAFNDDEVVWFENGSGWAPHLLSSTLDGVYTTEPVDIDQDGDLDVLASGRGSGRLVWYENTGGAWNEYLIEDSFPGVRSATAVDFDGDGDLDAVAAAEYDDHSGWWENLTNHRSAAYPNAETITSGVDYLGDYTIVDIDRDGSPEIVDHRRSSEFAPDIVIWNQSGGVWSPNPIVSDFDGPTSAVVVDIDRDGILDIVAAAIYSNAVAWFEGNGDGSYTKHLMVTGYEASHVAAADLDCDGDVDVVSDALNTDSIAIWWNDGAGASWTREDMTMYGSGKKVFVEDLVGDAAPDLLVSHGSVTDLYENLVCAGGGWSSAHTFGLNMSDAAFGDIDGDGRIDIASTHFPDDTIAVWLDPGTWTRVDLSTTADGANDVYLADLDQDGDRDLVTTTFYDGQLHWWENNGSGTGWTARLIDSVPFPSPLAVGDLDLDGDPDIVTGNWGADEMHIYSNRGGQYRAAYIDQAPASAGEGSTIVLMRAEFSSNGRAGDLDIELYRILLQLFDGSWVQLTPQQGDDLFAAFKVWHDGNANGVFDPGIDPLIESCVPQLVAGGYFSVLVDPGPANPDIPGAGGSEMFFVGVEMEFDAGAFDPGGVRVTAYSSPNSSIAYAAHPFIRLQGEPWSAAQMGPIAIVDDGLFADSFESGNTSFWSATIP